MQLALPGTCRIAAGFRVSRTSSLVLCRFHPTRVTIQHNCQQRSFIGIHKLFIPPMVFGGLLVTLWSWKCLMMVVFQNKIIYMPSLPPNARKETIEDYKSQCGGIQWREKAIQASDGTQITLCEASVDSGPEPTCTVYILYFQGNASSLPSRLPFLSPVLRNVRDRPSSNFPVRYVMVCCSYRGYWTSRGSPSEKGIAKDAEAAMAYIRSDAVKRSSQFSETSQNTFLVIWGQSIGAGVATNLATNADLFSKPLALKTLILETPFLSIRSMLDTLYPQKWLPYRYLWPFLRNHLDSWSALGRVYQNSLMAGLVPPTVLILEAGKDELVPHSHGDALSRRCVDLGMEVVKTTISGALHTEVIIRSNGRAAVSEAIRKATFDHSS